MKHELTPLCGDTSLIRALLNVGRNGPLSVGVTASPKGYSVVVDRRLMGKGRTMREAYDQTITALHAYKPVASPRQSARSRSTAPTQVE